MSGPERRRLALQTGLNCHLLEWRRSDPEADHTVVLVHGFLDHCWGWERVASLLGSRYHVVAPDARGDGDSDRVGAGGYYHFMDYVADLASLVDQLGRASTRGSNAHARARCHVDCCNAAHARAIAAALCRRSSSC